MPIGDDASRRAGRIIVLGSERSGTSVVTEMVHRWGAYAGEPDELTGPSEHSPHGQWEYEPLWRLLEEIGDFPKGATWWDPKFDQRVRAKLDEPEMVRKARVLMAVMDSKGTPWVWKDPALCHFLSFWRPLWGDVTYVITVRHPADIARSWQRFAVPAHLRDSVDLTACNLLRWQHMMLSVLRATDDVDGKIFVAFEGLIRQPTVEARRLARFLDRRFGGVTDDARIAAMADAVDPPLRRNRFDRPLDELAESTTAQRSLYQLLRLKVQDPTTQFVDEFPMPDGWWTFIHESEAILRSGG